MAAPSIPPRPSRGQNMPSSSNNIDIPVVPARPRRNVERSISPNRDSFARSPLHEPSYTRNGKAASSSKLGSSLGRDLPPRSPSVNLPSVGQEGNEYASFTPEPTPDNPLEQAKTTNDASDLPLHAPKASLPVSTAKQRIAAVTRTDSSQAAAIGIGKASTSETDLSHTLTRSSSRQSQTRSRPPSLYKQDTNEEHESGIPMIGLHVPMYPNAGDVQAPTPSPGIHTPAKGVGFFNNVSGQTPRNHSRTKSGREVFHGPPGSYGLHGHGGINKTDPFEKAWYDKHPEAMAREAKGEYGPAINHDRSNWAMSTEELNKLVHSKSLTGMGEQGASPDVVGTPGEDIGYIASEEYANRLSSRPGSTKPRRPSSQTYAESPLGKMSFSANDPSERDDAVQAAKSGFSHDDALESEVEDDIIHVDPLAKDPRRYANNAPHLDLGAASNNHGFVFENDEGVPILASDEIAIRPESAFMQPAVEPEFERRSSTYLDLDGNSRPHSRSNSINSVTQHHLAHFVSREHRPDSIGTPLEDVHEYEPLFPDEDEQRSNTAPAAMASSPTATYKRPDLARHHFPSKDVWEDVPDSLNYVTTVDTPQLPDESHRAAEHEPKGVFESPAAEAARKETLTAEDKQSFLPEATKRLAKQQFNPDVRGDVPTRPGHGLQRFPSHDIWEDTPDSNMHTTTIYPDDEEEKSPVDAKAAQIPSIPSRPARKTATDETDRQAPGIPGKPKPQIPARPSKLRSTENSGEAPLTKSLSKESSEGADTAPAKSKPAVPARPAGGKIAALQANFMSDLNKKLGLGPQAPKKEEATEPEVEEKAPLADARKGRARGPQRRKPGVSPSGAGEDATPAPPSKPVFRFTISRPQTIWEVDEGVLNVPVAAPDAKTVEAVAEAATSGTPAHVQLATKEEDKEVASEDAPAEQEIAKDPSSSSAVDTSVQTGETQLEVPNSETGGREQATVYLGGKAQEEGSVVVTQDGKEHVSGGGVDDAAPTTVTASKEDVI